MCDSSGGPGGTTQYNWNDNMAPRWDHVLNVAGTYADDPLAQYGGQRIADINSDQNAAMGAIRNFAYGSGNDATIAANGQLYKTLSGDYLSGADRNPFATQANAYSGQSPYFDRVLGQGLDDISQAYQQGTAADTTRMFNLSGAFGGSAHQQKMANNEAALAKQMGNFTSGMLNDQYTRSAGLEESRLGRANAGFENERARQMGAISGGQNEQALALERYRSLLGVGDVQRGLTQDQLNLGYNDWQAQQQHPFQQLDWLTGLFGRAQGGMSPNSTTTTSGYAASPFSQVLGAGLLGYGAMR